MSIDAKNYVIPQPPQPAIAVAGADKYFPVRRIWCVGRNYVEHIKEMGQDVREPPFFFAKPADAIVADGGTVPYPPLTKDMHHEVELVVALENLVHRSHAHSDCSMNDARATWPRREQRPAPHSVS